MVEIEEFDPGMLIFIDETGCEMCSLERKYGYCLRGIQPISHQLLVFWKAHICNWDHDYQVLKILILLMVTSMEKKFLTSYNDVW